VTTTRAGSASALAGALAALLVLPAVGAAQEPAPREAETVPLRIRRNERPEALGPGRAIVHPDPRSDAVARQVETDAAEFEQRARAERLLREERERARARPDLAPDVRSGIQQRNLQRLLAR